MTSLDFKQTISAFDIERQMLAQELAQSIASKETIAAGLLLCLSFLVGRQVDGLQIVKLDRIYPLKRNQGLIDFKLVCRLPNQTQVDLGICVLPSPDFEYVTEACTRLLSYKDFGLDRLCLLRPGDLMTDVYQLPTCLPKLLSSDIGGHFIPLKTRDLLTILTTLSVFRHKDQYLITSEMITAYLTQQDILTSNILIKNILATAQF